jgi:aryl-alcohol dehydrogenase-like predicted oxidoreductase
VLAVKNRLHCEDGRLASTFAQGTIGWGTKTCGQDLDRLYDAFRALGGNIFDSAHVYTFWMPNGMGSSERALGEIVRRRGDRKNVILATKGGHPHMAGGYDRPDDYLSPRMLASDIRDSLERLSVDRIDLYFLHRDDPRVPVDEIIDALNDHVERRQIDLLGASNWTTARIAAANEYARRTGKRGFVTHQAKLSLAVPVPSKDPTVPPFGPDELKWHEQTGMSVCAYSPTAGGFFATNGEKGSRGYDNPASKARLRVVNQLSVEIGATPNQIALAYLLHQRFPVIPILGTTSVEHLADALGASKVSLSDDQVRALSASE